METESTTVDTGAVVKLLEFFFSDANLSKDRWMVANLDAEGYLGVDTLPKFNKIKNITSNEEELIKAIKACEFLELSPDNSKVRRKVPFNPQLVNDVDSRTVYAENLGEDYTHASLTTLFEAAGPVVYVSIPRKEGQAKGFVFIEYKSAEAAAKAVSELNKYSPTTPTELRVMSKQAWLDMKQKFKDLVKKQSRPAQKSKRPEEIIPAPTNIPHFGPGVFVRYENLKDNLTKHEFKVALESNFPVAFVDFKKGSVKGVVRCFNAEEAKKLVESKAAVQDKLGDVKIQVLEGEEEREYVDKVKQFLATKGQGNAGEKKPRKNQKTEKSDKKEKTETSTEEPEKTKKAPAKKSKKKGAPKKSQPQGKRTVFQDDDAESKDAKMEEPKQDMKEPEKPSEQSNPDAKMT